MVLLAGLHYSVAVRIARAFFHIPYYHAEMQASENADGQVHFTAGDGR